MKLLIEYFLLSMFVTFAILYVFQQEPKVIIKYPNLKDDISNMYVDDNNICYRYHKSEIKCPI